MNTILKRVKNNIRRTPFQAIAASMVMFITFLTLLLFIVLAFASQQILKYYESKPQAIAFFKDNTTVEDINLIQEAITKTGKIKELKYVSKDQALNIYKERNKNNPTLLELVTANILPSSLEISTHSPKDLAPIAEILKREPVVDEVVYPEDVIQSLASATNVIRSVGLSAVAFLILFAFLVIVMIIGFKIRLKRNEIEIMRLLGASNWFIRAPFILEGMFYGAIGTFTAWIFGYILLWYFSPYLQNSLGDIKLFPISPLFMISLLFGVLLIAIIIGGLGSLGAVRRYLKI